MKVINLLVEEGICTILSYVTLLSHLPFISDSLFIPRTFNPNFAEEIVLRGCPQPSSRMAKVCSGYIRQVTEENLLIPGRCIHTLDCIGQGEPVSCQSLVCIVGLHCGIPQHITLEVTTHTPLQNDGCTL